MKRDLLKEEDVKGLVMKIVNRAEGRSINFDDKEGKVYTKFEDFSNVFNTMPTSKHLNFPVETDVVKEKENGITGHNILYEGYSKEDLEKYDNFIREQFKKIKSGEIFGIVQTRISPYQKTRIYVYKEN
jgi:hypothetical protein